MQIRTYLLIDQMQPQYGALTGKTMQGEIPVEGMAEIYIETAPASDIYKVMDIALKTTNVRAGALAVEREYGSLEIHSSHQESVLEAGRCALESLGLTENDRLKPEILSSLLISNVDPFEAQLINRTSFGGLLLRRSNPLCVGSDARRLHRPGGQRSRKGSQHHAGELHPTRTLGTPVLLRHRR